jgi:hypothetical protein
LHQENDEFLVRDFVLGVRWSERGVGLLRASAEWESMMRGTNTWARCGFVLGMIGVAGQAYATAYDTMVTRMEKLATDHSSLVTVTDIGNNDQNIPIRMLRIEDPQSSVSAENKVKHMVVAVHHGNEQQGAEVAMQFATDIVKFMNNPSMSSPEGLVDHIWYVIPVVNISGFNTSSRYELDKNGKAMDPNRDYEDVCVTQTKWRLASSRNLDAFMKRENIVGAVTIHGYIGTFTYPWGIYTTEFETKDDDFFSDAAAAAVKANGYRIGTHGDVVYPAAGSFEDYAYYKFGIWAMLLEVRRGASVTKDATALEIYFSHVPKERSVNNQHIGQCTQTRPEDENGRPLLSRP